MHLLAYFMCLKTMIWLSKMVGLSHNFYFICKTKFNHPQTSHFWFVVCGDAYHMHMLMLIYSVFFCTYRHKWAYLSHVKLFILWIPFPFEVKIICGMLDCQCTQGTGFYSYHTSKIGQPYFIWLFLLRQSAFSLSIYPVMTFSRLYRSFEM